MFLPEVTEVCLHYDQSAPQVKIDLEEDMGVISIGDTGELKLFMKSPNDVALFVVHMIDALKKVKKEKNNG